MWTLDYIGEFRLVGFPPPNSLVKLQTAIN